MILIYADMFLYTIELTFDPDFTEDSKYSSLYFFNICVFCLDIIIKFKTSFYEHGTLVKNQKKIRQNYWKKEFMFDFLSVAGMTIHFLEVFNSPVSWIVLVFFF